MAFAAGSFLFPTSTGDHSVTGVGFQPALVVMFGSNQATEDTLLTSVTRPGLFLSICVNDYDGVGIKTFCISIAGNTGSGGTAIGYTRFSGHTGNAPIRMQNTTSASGIDYRANGITFDSDGFTLTVSHAAGADRPIHWWAVSDDMDVAGIHDQDTSGDFDVNFAVRSILGLNGPATGGLAEVTTNSDSWLHFGSAHYPSDAVSTTTRVSAESHTGCLPSGPLGREGFTEQFQYSGTAGNRVCFDLRDAGVAIGDDYVTATPTALHGDTVTITTNSSLTSHEVLAVLGIDGIGSVVTTPADVGDIVTTSSPSWFNKFQLVMFSTVNGANVSVSSAQLRYGLGVLHPDYQGCVVMGDDGSFFQSRSVAVAHCTAGGEETAVGEINGSNFTLETAAGGSIVVNYHAFGILEAPWTPQIYRRVI
jgi:hypothetical protein